MTTWVLLAPGPSASGHDVERYQFSCIGVGVVGNAYEIAPWADFIAATDSMWWAKNPKAKRAEGAKYTMHVVDGVTKVAVPPIGVCNSGVLALECAKRHGATKILLFGFDMHGTHFFGRYTNGLRNTTEVKRKMHLKQYERWQRANPDIEVINCTKGSALRCFPMAGADTCLT